MYLFRYNCMSNAVVPPPTPPQPFGRLHLAAVEIVEKPLDLFDHFQNDDPIKYCKPLETNFCDMFFCGP